MEILTRTATNSDVFNRELCTLLRYTWNNLFTEGWLFDTKIRFDSDNNESYYRRVFQMENKKNAINNFKQNDESSNKIII